MTLKELYKSSVNKLNDAENSEIDVRIILKKVLEFSETDFLMNMNQEISHIKTQAVNALIDQRRSGMPVQYIIGEWDFYGITFKVNRNVLIPRPETEILCEIVIDYLKDKQNPVIADLCAGSGCIGITVKRNISDSTVIMIEKSPGAAEVCRENINNILGEDNALLINGDIFQTESFENLPLFDMIVSNPPYIKSSDISALQSEVLKEPIMALDGGKDGLDFYRLLVDKWTERLKADGIFAFECGEDQADHIKSLLERKGFEVNFMKDYSDVDRFVIGKRCKI